MRNQAKNLKYRYSNRFARLKSLEISEKELQTTMEQLLRLFSWRFYHTRDSRHSVEGFPDVIALRPPRRLVFELKKEGEDLTPEQIYWLNDFQKIGFEVYVWRPHDIEEAAKVLG